jgi:hypothetical protein
MPTHYDEQGIGARSRRSDSIHIDTVTDGRFVDTNPEAMRADAVELISRPADTDIQRNDQIAEGLFLESDRLREGRERSQAAARARVGEQFTASATIGGQRTDHLFERTETNVKHLGSKGPERPQLPPPDVTERDVEQVVQARRQNATPDAKHASAGKDFRHTVWSASKGGFADKPSAEEGAALEKLGRVQAGDDTVEMSAVEMDRALQAIERSGVNLNPNVRHVNRQDQRLQEAYQGIKRQQYEGARVGSVVARDIQVGEDMTRTEWLSAFEEQVQQLPPAQRAAARQQAEASIPQTVRQNEAIRLSAQEAAARTGATIGVQREAQEAQRAAARQDAFERDIPNLNSLLLVGDEVKPGTRFDDLTPSQQEAYNKGLADGSLSWTEKNGEVVYNDPPAARGGSAREKTYTVGGQTVSASQAAQMSNEAASPEFQRVVEGIGALDTEIQDEYEGAVVELPASEGDTASRLLTEAREIMQEPGSEDMTLFQALYQAGERAIERTDGQLAPDTHTLLSALKPDLQREATKYTRQRLDTYNQKRAEATNERLDRSNVSESELSGYAQLGMEIVESVEGTPDLMKIAEQVLSSQLQQEGLAPAGQEFERVRGLVARDMLGRIRKKHADDTKLVRDVEMKYWGMMMPGDQALAVGTVSAATSDDGKPGVAAYTHADGFFVKGLESLKGTEIHKVISSQLPKDAFGVYKSPNEGQSVQEYMAERGWHNFDTPPVMLEFPSQYRDGMQLLYARANKDEDPITYDLFHDGVARTVQKIAGDDKQFEVNMGNVRKFMTLLGKDAEVRDFFLDTDWIGDSRTFDEFQTGLGKKGVTLNMDMAEAVFNGYANSDLAEMLGSDKPKVREFAVTQAILVHMAKQANMLAYADDVALSAFSKSNELDMGYQDIGDLLADSRERARDLFRRSRAGDLEAGRSLDRLTENLQELHKRYDTHTENARNTLKNMGVSGGGRYENPFSGKEYAPDTVLESLESLLDSVGADVPSKPADGSAEAADDVYLAPANEIVQRILSGDLDQSTREQGLTIVRQTGPWGNMRVEGVDVSPRSLRRRETHKTAQEFMQLVEGPDARRQLRLEKKSKQELFNEAVERNPRLARKDLEQFWEQAETTARETVYQPVADRIARKIQEAQQRRGSN